MLQEQQLFANRYLLVKRLGQGAFSEVWKAEDTKAGNLTVALKIYAPEKGLDENGAKTFSEEFSLVFNMSHQNLLTPTYFDEYNGSPYLVLPFCEKGSALNLVGSVNEETVAHFLYDVSSALTYLHENGVIHQDIKPDNVLIDSNGSFKVTDFGISTKMRSTLRRSVGDKKGAGTMAYMGPERFSRNPETIKASDIWSLGATAYELMCGDVPFGDLGGGLQKGGAEIPEITGDYPAKLKELVERCLNKETWDRPTAEQIRNACEKRIKENYWDLSGLGPQTQASTTTTPTSSGRPTVKKVDIAEDLPPVTNTPPEDFGSEEKPKKKKTVAIILSLLGIALVAVLLVLFIPSENKRWKDLNNKPDATFDDYFAFCSKYPDGKHANEAIETMFNMAVADKCVDCLDQIQNGFSDYDISSRAQNLIVEIENEEINSAVSQVEDRVKVLDGTWQQFTPLIEDLNDSWTRLEDLQQEVDLYLGSSTSTEPAEKIKKAQKLLKEGVETKISALEKNIELGSTAEVEYVKELKKFAGFKSASKSK